MKIAGRPEEDSSDRAEVPATGRLITGDGGGACAIHGVGDGVERCGDITEVPVTGRLGTGDGEEEYAVGGGVERRGEVPVTGRLVTGNGEGEYAIRGVEGGVKCRGDIETCMYGVL